MQFFEWFVGFRYLFSPKTIKKHSFFSLTTAISVLGVAFGVMTLIVVLSVMNGFGKDLRDKTLSIKSHILIQSEDFSPFEYSKELSKIKSSDRRIQKVEPTILKEMMVRYQGTISSILLKGVETLEKKTKSNFPAIVLGQELAQALGAFEGDMIEIISPLETMGPLGSIPKAKKFEVTGLLNTGVYEYDMKLATVSLEHIQNFLEYENKIEEIEIWISDIDQTSQVITNIQKLSFMKPFLIRDWKVLNKNLLGALQLEKIAMFVILSFIVLVAALNIITAMTRVCLEKKREISIFKAMGAKSKHILMIFLIQGIFIGFTGIILGCLGGLGICYVLNHYQFIRLPDIYYSTVVPVNVEFFSVLVIAIMAFCITIVSALYPAWKASRVHSLEGIRI